MWTVGVICYGFLAVTKCVSDYNALVYESTSNLADYVNAIKIGINVICIEDVSKRDDMAEVEIINKTWLHDSGVVIRCSRENELVKYSSNACPECSIRWHVVDAAGQDIRPLEKTFHNACQESYWLKVNRQTHLPV